MARSPIRGVDPHAERVSGGDASSPDLKTAEAETTQNESEASSLVISDAKPSDDQPVSTDSEPAAPEAPLVREGAGEAAPEVAKAPLKKPLGLSIRKPVAEPKPPPSEKSQIDAAIELTLSAANTAVDAAQEIQRLRNELQIVAEGSRRSKRLLFAAILLIAIAASAGLSGAYIFYTRSFTVFEAAARTNVDILRTFAGEVKGLVATSKAIEETVKVSAQALSGANAQTEEIRKAIQGFAAAQKALESKIAPASAYDKQFSGLKQPIDDLLKANDVINSRLIEIENARIAYYQKRKAAAVEQLKVEPPKTTPKPAAPKASENESMIRYP